MVVVELLATFVFVLVLFVVDQKCSMTDMHSGFSVEWSLKNLIDVHIAAAVAVAVAEQFLGFGINRGYFDY
jgi:hypothetical protein